MKRYSLAVVGALVLAALVPLPAQARTAVSFNFFYDQLEPYGDWIHVGDYGYCWTPRGIGGDWYPYSDGYWAWTDYGWTWISYEDFGSITYHYGRWVLLDDPGWVWVPDYEWGPAWVSWRSSDDYIGWAPLPPAARFRRGVGISVWADSVYDIGPGYYNFCHSRHFGAPVLRPLIVDRSRNVTIIRNTTNVTNIFYENNVVYNTGPDYAVLAGKSERKIERLNLERVTDVDLVRGKGKRVERQNNKLRMLAPVVEEPKGEIQVDKVAKRIENARVNKGWGRVKDESLRKELREEYKKQARAETPEAAPAKRMRPERIKSIVQADDETIRKQAAEARAPEGPARREGRKTAAELEAEAAGKPGVETREEKVRGREQRREGRKPAEAAEQRQEQLREKRSQEQRTAREAEQQLEKRWKDASAAERREQQLERRRQDAQAEQLKKQRPEKAAAQQAEEQVRKERRQQLERQELPRQKQRDQQTREARPKASREAAQQIRQREIREQQQQVERAREKQNAAQRERPVDIRRKAGGQQQEIRRQPPKQQQIRQQPEQQEIRRQPPKQQQIRQQPPQQQIRRQSPQQQKAAQQPKARKQQQAAPPQQRQGEPPPAEEGDKKKKKKN